MSKVLEKVSAVCILGLLTALAPLAVLWAEGNPKIEAREGLYKFGTVYRGLPVKHAFSLVNGGTDTLRIDQVRSSCGCTVALADKKVLAPGDSTSILVNFDSARYSGSVHKDIYVESNDPNTPITKLSLEGEVKVDLDVSPTRIYFSGLKDGERLERKITISNLSREPIDIREIASTVPEIHFDLPKLKLAPGESTDLSLVVDKVNKDTKLTGSLTIRFSGPQKEVTVQLYGGTVN